MHGGQNAFALYERCTDALPPTPDRTIDIASRSLAVVLTRIANEIGYGFR